MSFIATTASLPSRDVARSIEFYRDVLGFDVPHSEDGFAVLQQGGARVNIWGATDDGWQSRTEWGKPVVSGAESFIAGTAGCRIQVEGVDELFALCKERGVVHPNSDLRDEWWGTREFTALDPDGNIVGFYEERSA